MKTIALVNWKGGVGKTALAVNLAVYAHRKRRRVILIDIDPQASAANWNNERDKDDQLDVVKIDASALRTTHTSAQRQGFDLAIIDTSEIDFHPAHASNFSDFVLIPTLPFTLDLKTTLSTLEAIAGGDTPYAVVLNKVPRTYTQIDKVRSFLEELNFPVLPQVIHEYAAFKHSTQGGSIFEYEPDGPAADEVAALYYQIRREIDLDGQLPLGNNGEFSNIWFDGF